MNDKLSYNGVVTLIQRVNNRIVSSKCYNNGTNHLFEAYARAICGQRIDNFVPKCIDVGTFEDGKFKTKIKNGVTIPVLPTFKSADIDNNDVKYGVPYCRVNINLLNTMFNGISTGDQLTVQLKSYKDDVLAEVIVPDLSKALIGTTSGVQLIMLWDLYITN